MVSSADAGRKLRITNCSLEIPFLANLPKLNSVGESPMTGACSRLRYGVYCGDQLLALRRDGGPIFHQLIVADRRCKSRMKGSTQIEDPCAS
jgi:hypothetical protein